MAKIRVQDTQITVVRIDERDYISLTDMANGKQSESRAADIIKNWIRTRYTIEFLGTWEMIHNPNFKVVEFDHFRMQAGLPNFVMSVSEWIEKTNAIGIIVKKGRYGGTYAFKDIAFEFGTAISVPFKLYLIEEFQRLKEANQKQLGWTAKRELSKINYHIHTDAIKNNLIPEEITTAQTNIIYAEEADVLNVAMFGMTAKQWREANPELKGNIRDYATINELICLSNMENINAVLINEGMPQSERLVKLNKIAIQQMQVLEDTNNRKLLIT
ncbi:MAG: KilA-N domain-containing protein [Prevotella sp.]|nr:KilA-N domain-containing protein [Prevotella sp.]